MIKSKTSKFDQLDIQNRLQRLEDFEKAMKQSMEQVHDNLHLLEKKIDNRNELQNSTLNTKVQQLEDANEEKDHILNRQEELSQMEQQSPTSGLYSTRNLQNLRRSIRWDVIDDYTEEDDLDQDAFGLMMLTRPLSKTWLLGLVAFILQVTLGMLVIFDQSEVKFGDTPLDIPIRTSTQVIVTQFIAIILAIMTQADILIGIRMILIFPLQRKQAWMELIDNGANPIRDQTNKNWYLHVLVPNMFKVFEGVLILIATIIIIIQSDSVVELLKDFSGLFVISSIDNVLFKLAAEGYFGKECSFATAEVKEKKLKNYKKDVKWSLISILVAIILVMLSTWAWFTYGQTSLRYVEKKYPLCPVTREIGVNGKDQSFKSMMGDGKCHFTKEKGTNIEMCGWDGGDCEELNNRYPKCIISDLSKLGDGNCNREEMYNSIHCGFDNGDCIQDNIKYKESNGITKDCIAAFPDKLADETCDPDNNSPGCHYDAGDCLIDGYPDCFVDEPERLGDGICNSQDKSPYNTEVCGFDKGDCDWYNHQYNIWKWTHFNCDVDEPWRLSDEKCDGEHNTKDCGWDAGDCVVYGYPDCHVDIPDNIDNGECNGGEYNTEVCGWDGGSCVDFNENYPNCDVDRPYLIGDGQCSGGEYNTKECGWDGGDCLWFNDNQAWIVDHPNCNVAEPWLLSNGMCNSGPYNTLECDYDAGDCPEFNELYPNCRVDNPFMVGDGTCHGVQYNTEECRWDGGDCLKFNELYPNCHVESPDVIGNKWCDRENNTPECGWDGGDCLKSNELLEDYPNCTVKNPNLFGNGVCSGEGYNIEDCGWDAGDCDFFNEKYPTWILDHPNCVVDWPWRIGDGACEGGAYNTEVCAWDAGDCLDFNEKFPNCNADLPRRIGDGTCDGKQYNTSECGYDEGDCL